jgi:hypothetical protein
MYRIPPGAKDALALVAQDQQAQAAHAHPARMACGHDLRMAVCPACGSCALCSPHIHVACGPGPAVPCTVSSSGAWNVSGYSAQAEGRAVC